MNLRLLVLSEHLQLSVEAQEQTLQELLRQLLFNFFKNCLIVLSGYVIIVVKSLFQNLCAGFPETIELLCVASDFKIYDVLAN